MVNFAQQQCVKMAIYLENIQKKELNINYLSSPINWKYKRISVE